MDELRYGHHNVYYLDYDQPIRMPATLPGARTRRCAGTEALVIPHHTGYSPGFCGKDWDYHDEQLSPFVEIYSLHGSSEEPGGIRPLLTAVAGWGPGAAGGSVQEGLARGYKLGIMCSSDAHGDHPGAYDLGLIAAYADELTRPALVGRLQGQPGLRRDRRPHRCWTSPSTARPMGATVRSDGPCTSSWTSQAWDQMDRVDVIKNNASCAASSSQQGPEGGSGRPAAPPLHGGVGLRPPPAQRVGPPPRPARRSPPAGHPRLPRPRRPPRRPRHRPPDRDACAWTSRTIQVQDAAPARRFADAMWFEVEAGPDALLHFTLNTTTRQRRVTLTARDILSRATLVSMEPYPATNNGNHWARMETYAKFRVHRGSHPAAHRLLRLGGHPPRPPGQTDFYYVRVTQRNGQRAWSSPVWVEG